ncbi:MAG: CHAT domain-containing protein, partial [Desulfobacterales bacterium]|nr:CHAT domain-containing protein [Desulfobacterales bacterium]
AALQLNENVLGKEHPDTLTSMNNLAGLYKSQGRYGEAEPLYKAALQLRENVLGKEHPDTLTSMNNLAGLYSKQGRYGEAEPLYKAALQLNENVLGKEHPDTLTSMNNLAFLYESQGRYGEAEPLYKAALQLRENVLGKEHPNTISSQLNYFGLLINKKEFSPAFHLLEQTEARLLTRSFQQLYTTSDERIRRLFLRTISNFQDIVLSFARQYPNAEHHKYATDVILRWKQVYAEEEAFQHRMLQVSHDPEMKQLKNVIAGLRKELSHRIYHKKQGRDIAVIRHEMTAADSKIREKTSLYKPELEVSKANLNQVINRLPKNSALIEFRMYDTLDVKTGEYSKSHWAACLILPDIHAKQQIFFEDLGEVKEILNVLKKSKKQPDALYQYLLGKFDKHIKHIKTLFIAPDSILNLISFASLKLPDGKYLAQRQQVNRLHTGRDLLSSSPMKPADILIAVGGVDYGDTAGKAAGVTKGQLNEKAAMTLKPMKYLPHSKKEANLIASLYRANCKEGKIQVYLGTEPAESKLKQMEKAPRILHLSTHGFYMEQDEAEKLAQEHPLLLSGLALANANLGLRGKVDENGDDGLLYSLEVLEMNLQGTELVSLSACNTAKGVLDYSEGVYGLVRAFRTAGAKNVLMTLSTVGDKSSMEFFTKFYEIWLSSEDSPSPAKALHRTRLHFIKKYPDKPEKWSPYVMVGG